MHNRILLILVVILSLVLVIMPSSIHTTFFNSVPLENKEKEIKIAVKNTEDESITKIELEDYIIGVVAAEMPASFNEEALKAQAVASRTYARYKMQSNNSVYDVVTDVSNQSYITIEEMKTKWQEDFEKYYNKIKNAVNMTKGEIMYYNDEIVEAYYFAMSNGYTEESSKVFKEERDYLQSVSSNYETSLKNFLVTKEFTKEEICSKLNITCEKLNFTEIKRSNTNRVNSLKVNGKEYKGTEFRKLLDLRSTDFEITNKDNKIYITTKGFGHGVGMSQYGANGMAKEGYNYKEILNYYYKNVKISSI